MQFKHLVTCLKTKRNWCLWKIEDELVNYMAWYKNECSKARLKTSLTKKDTPKKEMKMRERERERGGGGS
jgi:hypothetical protein